MPLKVRNLLNKELEKLSDQRNSRLQRKDIAQREVDTLEGPKKEAEMYIRTDKKHLELKSVDVSFQLQNIAKTMVVAEEEEVETKDELWLTWCPSQNDLVLLLHILKSQM